VGETDTFEVTTPDPVYVIGDLTNVVEASGDDGHGGEASDSATWTVEILVPGTSIVTNTEFCYFDVDPSRPGEQFRVLFTPDPANGGKYMISATNPGQFYYSVFYSGEKGTTATVTIRIPYPFVTHGAQPVHAYSDFDVKPCSIGDTPDDPWFCFWPTHGVSIIEIDGSPIALGGYAGLGSYQTITVKAIVPDSGLLLVTVHLEYGLLKSTGYSKGVDDKAILPGPDGIIGTADDMVIPSPQAYDFRWSLDGGANWYEPTIESENNFKKNPGVAGQVVDGGTSGLAGVTVRLYSPKGVLIGAVVTDVDGYYFFSYKHTGKAAYYKVERTDTGEYQMVLLKANGLVYVNFTPPSVTLALPSSPASSAWCWATAWIAGIVAMLGFCILISTLAAVGPRQTPCLKVRRTRVLRRK
jgi:hypothetical protein